MKKKLKILSVPIIAVVIFMSQLASANSIRVIPNNSISHNTNELVTVGIPFSACAFSNSDNFRLLNESLEEVPIFIKKTLNWFGRTNCQNSIRSVKVQFRFDATEGAKIYTWDLNSRDKSNDISEQPISEVITDRVSLKGSFSEPRVFAINNPDYLVSAGIIPPTTTLQSTSYDQSYYPEKWEYDAKDFNYTSSTASNWLFDRVSTNYKQAIRSGDVEYYREAYLSHEFWIDKIETTGKNTSVVDYCVGGFDMDGKADTFGSGGAGCDPKYIYAEPFKLHIALTGDDSWTPEGPAETTREGLFLRMADTLYSGSERCPTAASCRAGAISAEGFSSPYTNISAAYTERKAGFGLQTMLNLCELTGDSQVCSAVDIIVDNMYLHMTSNPDGLGNTGYLGHSWHLQEGSFPPYIGMIESASSGNVLAVNKTIEDIGAVLVPGDSIRVKATASSGSSQYSSISSISGGPSSWLINITDTLSAQLPNSVKGGNQGQGNVKYELKSDRVFSPWTQAIIADGLWQYYNWVDNQSKKDKAKALMLGFANSVAAYAIDGTRIKPSTKALVENAFGVQIFNSEILSKVGCSLSTTPYPRYVANTIMNSPKMVREYADHMFASGGYSDLHIPETLFQLSLGVYFEENTLKQDAMLALADDSIEWFDKYSCTSGNRDKGSPLNDPPRAYSWQNKSDPYGTYSWVKQEKGIVTVPKSLANPPSAFTGTKL